MFPDPEFPDPDDDYAAALEELAAAQEVLARARQERRLKLSPWRQMARPDQLPPEGNWRTWYVRGGRGSGKTWTASHVFAEWMLSDPEPGEWGIVAPTYADAWSICIEGESGLLAALGTNYNEVRAGESELVHHWHRSFAELGLRSGHIVRVASAEDGALHIQGKNLKGLWGDEIGLWDKWDTAWNESIKYAVRKGRAQILVTGTPKKSRAARKLVRLLLDDPEVPVSRLRTTDNEANLSASFFAEVVGKSRGTRLERQELEGDLLADVEGALWTPEVIDASRVTRHPDLVRVVVAIDPAVTSKRGSDETGIIVAGDAGDGHGYVLADYSMRGTPDACMKKAVWAYKEHRADRIIGEANNGGDYLGSLLRTVDQDIPYRKVTASRGKAVRAEPVSALYEQARIHHVGVFPDLEDQMCTWLPTDDESPDRMDACLAAGTSVLTARGEVPVEDVVPGEAVWTRAGWKAVTASRCTRRDAEVVTAGLSSGRTLTATPDHRVWVEGKGWSRMDALVWGDRLSAWENPPSRSPTGASRTSGTRTLSSALTASTTAPRAAAGAIRCTATSGAITTPARTFPQAGTSTTMITTRSTTTPATSSSGPPKGTPPSTPRLQGCRPSTLPRSSLSLRNGTGAPKGMNGTSSTASAPGRIASPLPARNASPAGKSSTPGSRMPGTARAVVSTVLASRSTSIPSPARSAGTTSSRTGTANAPRPAPVSVVRLSAGSERRDVYDLTVADVHEFCASGVIVHNCVWAFTELKGLSAGDWLEAYGVVTCPAEKCGRAFVGSDKDGTKRTACPYCRTPLETGDDGTESEAV
jgi:phage terminase large subunit-like protein